MALAFTKWQGCGNDFVLVDGRTSGLPGGTAELSRRVCDRHYGIGADGLIFVLPTEKDSFTVETGAGILTPRIVKDDGNITGVEVDMGEPVLEAKKIPVEGFGDHRVISEEIEVLGKRYKATCVSMGNPHCVVFVGDVDDVDMEKVGPAFESHTWFPRRTNTEFVVVRDREHLRMRVWERGAAVTLACGTGACATLVAAVLNGRSERRAEVELDGGRLTIEWSEKNNRIYMTGPAEKVFSGVYEGELKC